ncbi:MAG: hypothetical protein MRY83_06490 [Flavobacteriales bacterium]|nr:hypothetical protein [Flavobacteriales bacterium]
MNKLFYILIVLLLYSCSAQMEDKASNAAPKEELEYSYDKKQNVISEIVSSKVEELQDELNLFNQPLQDSLRSEILKSIHRKFERRPEKLIQFTSKADEDRFTLEMKAKQDLQLKIVDIEIDTTKSIKGKAFLEISTINLTLDSCFIPFTAKEKKKNIKEEQISYWDVKLK